ncbi:MAG: transposase [Burkholderiales bacterium]|nr:transposase [Burkholderiales bacterium]
MHRFGSALNAHLHFHCVVIDGVFTPALDGPRFIYWNYVSSSRERIERAKEDWRAQRTAKIPGETEWIPLPP